MNRFHLLTLGCPKNTVDSSHIERALTRHGFVSTDEEEADILIINTCAFINDAKAQSVNETLRLARHKQSNPNKKIIVFGCLGQRYGDELAAEIPEVDLVTGVGQEAEMLNYCKRLLGSPQHPIPDYPVPKIPRRDKTTYAYLKIAEGCSRHCTFCVIPSIRGRFVSIDREQLLQEASEIIGSGIRELILIGQDITEYGRDLRGYGLIDLLKDLLSLGGDPHIRLLYMNPSGIRDDLIEFIAKEERIIKYIDVPMQHSEDRILRLMGRSGSRQQYLKLIRKIRRMIPDVTLRTTFIVGFPTETEEDFQSLMDFVQEVGFDRLGAFMYSREDGTKAARLKGQIPKSIKQRRYDALMAAQASISYHKNLELVGRSLPAIVEEADDEAIIARLYSQAPEIDGSLIIDLRSEASGPLNIKKGDIIEVEVVGAYEYDLLGRLRHHL